MFIEFTEYLTRYKPEEINCTIIQSTKTLNSNNYCDPSQGATLFVFGTFKLLVCVTSGFLLSTFNPYCLGTSKLLFRLLFPVPLFMAEIRVGSSDRLRTDPGERPNKFFIHFP